MLTPIADDHHAHDYSTDTIVLGLIFHAIRSELLPPSGRAFIQTLHTGADAMLVYIGVGNGIDDWRVFRVGAGILLADLGRSHAEWDAAWRSAVFPTVASGLLHY